MKRATLIKMKTGNHRVASSGEAKALSEKASALNEANYQRSRAVAAQQQVSSAKDQGASEALSNKYVPYAVERVIEELVHAYGPELMKHAQELKDSDRSRRNTAWFDLSASFNPMDYRVMRIRGEIPAMMYEVQVPEF